jgi:hypothetical protein
LRKTIRVVVLQPQLDSRLQRWIVFARQVIGLRTVRQGNCDAEIYANSNQVNAAFRYRLLHDPNPNRISKYGLQLSLNETGVLWGDGGFFVEFASGPLPENVSAQGCQSIESNMT